MIKTKNPAVAAFAETVAMELSVEAMSKISGGAELRPCSHNSDCPWEVYCNEDTGVCEAGPFVGPNWP